MRSLRMGAVCGAVMLAMTGCVAGVQTVSLPPDAAEKQLTVGTVQREIRKGMSGAEVAGALGSPNIVTTDEQGREVWVYDRVASERVQAMEYGTLVLVGYSRHAGATTQRTLTVIVKFDGDKRVRDYAYHSSRF